LKPTDYQQKPIHDDQTKARLPAGFLFARFANRSGLFVATKHQAIAENAPACIRCWRAP
jgi:hypothetical protein